MENLHGIAHLAVSVRLPLELSGSPLFPLPSSRSDACSTSPSRSEHRWRLLEEFVEGCGDFALRSLGRQAPSGTAMGRYDYEVNPFEHEPTLLPKSLQFGPMVQSGGEFGIVNDPWLRTNDLLMESCSGKGTGEDYLTRESLAWLMASRRSAIFSPSASLRRHFLFLPPGILKRPFGSTTEQYLLLPYLTLLRDADTCHFRRTFAFGSFFVPLEADGKNPAKISSSQVRNLLESFGALHAWDFKQKEWSLEGDLLGFFGTDLIGSADNRLQTWFHLLLTQILRKACTSARAELIDAVTTNQLNVSAVWSVVLVGAAQSAFNRKTFDTWATHNDTPTLTSVSELNNLVAELLVVEPETDLLALCICQGHRNGREFLSFYGTTNYVTPCILSLASLEVESFPKNSALWIITWHSIMGAALSSAKAMIHGFHHELGKEAKLDTFLDINREFIVDLEELYNLDFRTKAYSRQYQRIKELDGIESDYLALREEVRALGDQLSVRSTQESTTGLRNLTMIGLWVAVIGTLATILGGVKVVLDLLKLGG